MQAYKASPLAHSHNVLGPRQPRLGQRLIQRFRIQSCLPSVQGGVTTIAVLTIYKGQKVQEENFRRSDCCPSVFSPGISPSVPTQKQQPKENLGKVRLKYFFVLWWYLFIGGKIHNTQHLCQVRSWFTEVITWHQPKPKHYFFTGDPSNLPYMFAFFHGLISKKNGNATIPPQKWVTFHTSFIFSFFAFPKKNG